MKHVALNEAGNGVVILDQSILPGEERYLELKTPEEMSRAIKDLQVRGAPAIGIFAGYAMAALAKQEIKPQSVKSCCGASGTSDDVFMQNLQNDKQMILIRMIMDIAKRMGLSVVAEGVETKEQVNFLRTVDCDIIQGYYFAKPMPRDEFEALLKSEHTA